MTRRNEEDHGFVLHVQKITDSKKIAQLLTRKHGKISVVFRENRKKNQFIYTGFSLSFVRWSGTGELKTLLAIEQLDALSFETNRALYCAMYINELLVRLLPVEQGHEPVFDVYQDTLNKLSQSGDILQVQEVLLRTFELKLMADIGLGVNFSYDLNGENLSVDKDVYYTYLSGQGFVPSMYDPNLPENQFSGAQLDSICRFKWSLDTVRAAKRLNRMALKPLLGGRPIKSRDLFQ